MNLKESAKKINVNIPAIYLCLKDEKTPIIAKILAGITVGYALSPIDLIPDFIPIFGYLDDALILPILVILTIKCIPNDIWQRNLIKSTDIWKKGKPSKWYYGILIVSIWILIILLVLKVV